MIKTENNNNTITTKAKYWVGVGYPENMIDDWQEVIGETYQLPYAYCIHDKDKDEDKDDRKDHVHIILVWANNTTYKAALELFNKLSKPGCKAFNTCEKVHDIRYMYNYLIHDTDDCRKKHKFQYPVIERVTGNNFDIGSYEQVSLADKHAMVRELSLVIIQEGFMNYLDFYSYVISNYDTVYSDMLISYSGHFERLTKSNYQKWVLEEENNKNKR